MHNAPPVVYPVGRFVWGARVGLALAVSAAAVLTAWLGWTDAGPAAWGWSLWGWGGAAAGTLWLLPREFLQQGELVWDGEVWHHAGPSGEDAPIALSLTFDGGRFMLLAIAAPAGDWRAWPRHALLRQSDMPTHWHGFRCAVYSLPKLTPRPA